MRTGLIGLPGSGKTTFFKLLADTGIKDKTAAKSRTDADFATVRVPDLRIDFLKNIYKPKKVTYASIETVDIPGIIPGDASSFHFFESVRRSDALVHVVRAFDNDEVVHIDGSCDAIRDIKTMDLELIFADLTLVEKRINSINAGKKVTQAMQKELEVLKKCREHLEAEKPVFGLMLEQEEKDAIKQLAFLTGKPVICLVNLDEKQFTGNSYHNREKVREYAKTTNMPLIEICARTELEISLLDEEDRGMFLQDMGIEETGVQKLAKAIYDILGLISFITVGEDEVRAWPVIKGSSAKQAGGRIHSDIERGFIRAEVVRYSDFENLGSMQKIKDNGLARLEGKEYIIEDGDIINFRFNV